MHIAQPRNRRVTRPTKNCSSCLLLAVALLLLLTLACCLPTTVRAALERPATITFGFYHYMNEPTRQAEGTQLYAGMKAAEKEVNDANVIDGVSLEIKHIEPAALTASAAVVTSTARNFSETVFGMVLTDWRASSSVSNVGRLFYNSTLPIVAPRQLSDLGFSNTSRYSPSLRQPPSTEYLMMLHHALNRERTRCTSFAVITRFFFSFAGIAPMLAQLGLPPPILIPLATSTLVAPNITQVFDSWLRGPANSTNAAPMCGLFLCLQTDVVSILSAMYNDARFDMERMTFYAAGYTSEGTWNSSMNGTAPFKRLRFVTNFPNPSSATKPVSIKYRAALANWLATVNMSAVPAAMKVLPFLSTPSYPALEGYLVVKWIAKIMSSMPSINRSLFLDAVYQQRYFFVEDEVLGPLMDRCLVEADRTLPCFCNKAMSTLYINAVDLSTGLPTALLEDAVAAGATTLTVPPEGCYLSPSTFKMPIAYALWSPQNNSPAEDVRFGSFHSVLRLKLNKFNNDKEVPTAHLSATWMNDRMPFLSGENVSAYFTRLQATRRPMVIVGDLFTNVSAAVINVVMTPHTAYEDAPLSTATAYSRYSWTLKPTLADLAHGLAYKLRNEYRVARAGRKPAVYVAAETADGYRLAVASLHTVQFAVEAGGASNLLDAATLRGALAQAVATASSGRDAVFFLSTVSAAVVVDAVNALVELEANAETAAIVYDRLVVAIATDQNNLYLAKFQAGMNTSGITRLPIYFGSYASAFWEPSDASRASVAALLSTTSAAVLESVELYAGVMLSELFTVALEAATEQYPTAGDLMDVLYRDSVLVAGGITVGPMLEDNCTADVVVGNSVNRECQCFKMLRTVKVYDFRGWLMNNQTYNPRYSWSMPGCGVQYEPLVLESSLNAALIAGIAAPCGAGAIGAMFYLVCCFGRRSNRSAPKDASVPFAMVFTDIQSSTSLWARAPEQMGTALDKHHELLRALLARHNGYEVKTIGDSFMVAFQRASDATSFALAIQTTLFAETWPAEIDDVYVALAQEAHEELLMNEDAKAAAERLARKKDKLYQWEDEVNYPLNWNGIRVRVGLHWGVGSVKLDPVSQGYDYYGTLVNTAARVESVGNGGQVLLTKDMYAQLEEETFDFGDVEIVALGPQPLRGLDQPVPLYQLSPALLRNRQFAALRLDMDVDVDDETSEGTATAGDDNQTRSSGANDETPETLLARLLRKQKQDGGLNEHLLRVVNFLETLLRTSPMAWRRETVKALLKKWHVHARKPREKEAAEKTLAYDLVALTARVGLAAEEALRAAATHTKGGDTGSDATSSVGRPGALRRRLSSLRRGSNATATSEGL